MKRKISIQALLFLLLVFLASGCSGSKGDKKVSSEATVQAEPVVDNETLLLLRDLEENGDYVNSQYFPSLIKASVVNDELNGNNLILDLRSPGSYSKGHIRGAVNKKFRELPEYLETGVKPFEYDKIIIVCDDGQLSSYTTCLLRLKGYGNVFALRWGMAGWNTGYAKEGWLKGVSGKFGQDLETTSNEAPSAKSMPLLNTGLLTGREIAESRFNSIFEEGPDSILVSADEVFRNPPGYFIINLERKDKYENGHIPGAVRYKPESTLGFPDIMATIPFDRRVVVYCGTGHNSGFATAFLRLLGYDARTLRYGNNSFMYDKMIAEKSTLSWLPFTLSESGNFPVVK